MKLIIYFLIGFLISIIFIWIRKKETNSDYAYQYSFNLYADCIRSCKISLL